MDTAERLGRIEERLDSLCDVLLDNGQPGILTKHDTRLGHLEEWRSYTKGALGVVAFLSTIAIALGGVILAHILK